MRTHTVALVGVSQPNPDGSDRHEIIKRCSRGEPLELRREPENPSNPDAVAVFRTTGQQIGYLSRKNAAWVAEIMDRGAEVAAKVQAIQKSGPLLKRQYSVVIDLTTPGAVESWEK